MGRPWRITHLWWLFPHLKNMRPSKMDQSNPRGSEFLKKKNENRHHLPGDSIRDLFIPDRWRSRFTLEKVTFSLTIPKRSRLESPGSYVLLNLFVVVVLVVRVENSEKIFATTRWSLYPVGRSFRRMPPDASLLFRYGVLRSGRTIPPKTKGG